MKKKIRWTVDIEVDYTIDPGNPDELDPPPDITLNSITSGPIWDRLQDYMNDNFTDFELED